jgi:asparagine synthase (glutamine-hydrolysing)
MSGVCGIGQRDGSAESLRGGLEALLADLADFGPAPHSWIGAGLALGQRQDQIYRRDRLESQPVLSGDLVLVAEARLIAGDDVARALGIGKDHQAISDSALILAAWQRWGEQALDRLDGEFCFALWDAAKKRLTLVRDHLGNRPLYYAPWSGGFAFSTSLTGLVRLPQVDTALNDCALADYLASVATEEASTPYRGVQRLEPGTVLHWTPGGVARPHRYWNINTAHHVRLPKAADYVEAVRERVQSVLAHCCDTDHAVGLVLSGGLDSSILAAMTARHLAAQGRTLLTASSVLPVGHAGPAVDERPYMQAVCAAYPTIAPHWVSSTGHSLLENARETARQHGQPTWNPFAVMDQALQVTLFQAGARVVIDGLHGDSMWSFEHPVFPLDLLLRGHVATAWREWLALSKRNDIGRLTLAHRLLTPYAALMPTWRRDFRASLIALTGPTAITLEMARQTRLPQRIRRERARGLPFLTLRAAQRSELASPLWPRVREEHARAGAAMGLSLRSPLWDRRVLELCLSAPPGALHRDGFGRSLAREIGRGIVPEVVRTRIDKGAFLPDFHARVRRERDAMHEFLQATQKSERVRDYLDVPLLQAALSDLQGEIPLHCWSLVAQSLIVRGIKVACFLLDYERGFAKDRATAL